MVARIAAGEVEDTTDDPSKTYHPDGGKKGGELTPERWLEIVKSAAAKWRQHDG